MGEDDNWTDQPIDLSDYVGRYEYLGSAVSIYFQFAAADMLQWQFPRMFDSQGQYDQYRDAIVSELGEPASFAKGTQYQLKAHAECHHAPTSLNYWHLEVKTIVDSIPPEEIENYSGAPRKRAVNQMIESLRAFSTLVCPNAPVAIPEHIYVSAGR